MGRYLINRKGNHYLPSMNEASHQIMRTARSQGLPALTRNDEAIFQTLLLRRYAFIDRMLDLKHDIDRECGYPEDFTPWQYRRMYDREGIANKVVAFIPNECWCVDPEIKDTEGDEVTPFGRWWNDFKHQPMDCEGGDIYHYWHRIDELSRIAFYGLLLVGYDDGADLSEPLEGIDEDGQPVPTGKKLNITFLRAFDQTQCRIQQFQTNPLSPRFAKPIYYTIRFVDLTAGIPEASLVEGNYFRRVHWSRIIHVADNRKSSEVYGIPAQRVVLNRLLDLRKTYGGSAEMFWKGGFPGYAFEVNPEYAAEAQFDEADKLSLRKEFFNYSENLQRYLPLIGMTVKSLAPQVASPKEHIEEHLRNIALSLDIPFRIWLGSEEAKMASSQDKRTHNERLHRRQTKYLNPMLIKTFINRQITLGVAPAPKDGLFKYQSIWPDLNKPTEQDKANLAITRTQAIVQYVTAGGDALIKPRLFLKLILQMPPDEVEQIIEENPDLDSTKTGKGSLLKDVTGLDDSKNGQNGKTPKQIPQGDTT